MFLGCEGFGEGKEGRRKGDVVVCGSRPGGPGIRGGVRGRGQSKEQQNRVPVSFRKVT